MEVFLGWSGDRSYATAQAFHEWLPKVIQAVEPFISSGIPKGKRWGEALAGELETTKVGILCLTSDNLDSKWILYEAGALSNTKDTHVCTFLLDIKPTDVEEPLASFQHTTFQKRDIQKLLKTINQAVGKSAERALSESTLEDFDLALFQRPPIFLLLPFVSRGVFFGAFLRFFDVIFLAYSLFLESSRYPKLLPAS